MGDSAPSERALGSRERSAGRATSGRRSGLALLLVALVASLLLGWQLSARYLWQDEAATAVMARRMLEHGKPLGFDASDGGNLITMDVFDQDDYDPSAPDMLPAATRDAETAVATFVARQDFKPDTTWIGQPWGQFVLAAGSFALFGEGTLQARAPFVLCAVLAVMLLFAFVRRRFDDPWMAALAVLFCLSSVYWVLHARQCRYYAPATLFLLVTLVAYLRWQDGWRLGATAFVASGWIWFQQDFGSFWPGMLVLGVDALRQASGGRGVLWDRGEREQTGLDGSARKPPSVAGVLGTFAVLAAVVLPFAWYYELWTRHKEPIAAFDERFFVTLYFLNQYQLPFVFLLAVGALALVARRRATPREWRVIGLCVAIVLVQLVFMTAVGPYGFYRYIVDCTPLAAIVMAFVCVRLVTGRSGAPSAASRAAAAVLALVMVVTPLFPEPARRVIPIPGNFDVTLPPPGTFVRGEWSALGHELANDVPDPNRMAVAFLRENLRPGEEVLINYEDAPLMFYLDASIRGGIQCFRLEDTDAPPPRYALIRRRPRICHRGAYDRAFARLSLQRLPFEAPDIPWGNNPDPSGHYSRWADDLDAMGLWDVRGWR